MYGNAGYPFKVQALLTELGVNIGIDGGAELAFEYAGRVIAVEHELIDPMLPMLALLQLLKLFKSKEGRFKIGGKGAEQMDLLVEG